MALDRTIAPKIKDAVEFDIQLKPYQKFILDNGVEVYAFEGGAQEVMLMELLFFAGNSYENKNWVAPATNYLLKNGTSSKSAFFLWWIERHFILAEEDRLRRKFRADFARYCAKTRRWL